MSVINATHVLPIFRSCLHQQLRKLASVSFIAHERSVTKFHIENERIDALCELLRHDRPTDQRRARYRGSQVAQRIKLAVSRSDFGSLADKRESTLLEHLSEFCE